MYMVIMPFDVIAKDQKDPEWSISIPPEISKVDLFRFGDQVVVVFHLRFSLKKLPVMIHNPTALLVI